MDSGVEAFRMSEPISKSMLGDWQGSYALREDPEDRARLTLIIRRDGSWTSDHWEPTDKARWYLADGMILLFEKPLDAPDANLSTAVVMKNGTLHLLDYQAKGGMVRLEKKRKAQQAAP